MYKKDIWDVTNQEWVSWDEILAWYGGQIYHDILNREFLYYEKYLQPKKNPTNVRNESKRNPSNTNNSQNKSKITEMNIRKPHMALHYKSKKLNHIIESDLVGIVPSTVPEDISTLVPEKIWNTINQDIKKDIDELFNVYCYQQWTATALMAYRIFENVLKKHVEDHLKESNIINIGIAIQKLEEHNYEASLIKKLKEYRDHRNNYMHGNKRAGADEAKNLVVDVMSIAIHIHNIKR